MVGGLEALLPAPHPPGYHVGGAEWCRPWKLLSLGDHSGSLAVESAGHKGQVRGSQKNAFSTHIVRLMVWGTRRVRPRPPPPPPRFSTTMCPAPTPHPFLGYLNQAAKKIRLGEAMG